MSDTDIQHTSKPQTTVTKLKKCSSNEASWKI